MIKWILIFSNLNEIGQAELTKIYDSNNYKNDFVAGEVIIGLKGSDAISTLSIDKALFPGVDIIEIANISNVNTLFGTADTSDSRRQIMKLKLASCSKQNVVNAISILKDNPNVAYAEPNYIITID